MSVLCGFFAAMKRQGAMGRAVLRCNMRHRGPATNGVGQVVRITCLAEVAALMQAPFLCSLDNSVTAVLQRSNQRCYHVTMLAGAGCLVCVANSAANRSCEGEHCSECCLKCYAPCTGTMT
jgi:hypothetical protein